MRTVAIVQVRMGSERLPGKALMEIGGRTVLEWVVRRAQATGVDEVVVATSDRPEDDRITGFGCAVLRGSPDDVLDRFYRCAHWCRADQILRVTADCPLLDPGLNRRIVDTLTTTRARYVSMSTRSNGLVQESFTLGALQRAWEHADEPYDREHVVSWMLRHEKTRFLRPDTDLGAGRYCVDTQEDLDRLRALYEANPDLFGLNARQIVSLHDRVGNAV